MIIHVSQAGLRLEAPEDLKGFKLLVADGLDDAAIAAVIGPAGRLAGTHAWIAPAWVQAASGRAGDADWMRGFDGMVAYAATKGWVDDTGAIRAHIERA